MWANGSIFLNHSIPAHPYLVNITNQDYLDLIAPQFAVIIGSSPVMQDDLGIRYREKALGNALADGIRAGTGAQIAFVNGGSIRAPLAAGPISFGKLVAILPFQNTLVLFRARGDVIFGMLENSVSRLCWLDSPSGNGRFLHMSGLDIGYNGCQPVGSRITFVNVWSSEDRNGTLITMKRALNLTEYYTFVINQFEGGGGDGYTMLVNNSLAKPVLGFSQPRQEFVIQKDWESRMGDVYSPLATDPADRRICNDTQTVAPRIASVQPTSGPLNGGTVLTVYGAGLIASDPTLKITIGDRGAECVVIDSVPLPLPIAPAGAVIDSGVHCTMSDASLVAETEGAVYLRASKSSALRPRDKTVARATGGDGTRTGFAPLVVFTYTAANLPCPPNAEFVPSAFACLCRAGYFPAPGNELSCRTTGDRLNNSPDPYAIVLAIVVPAIGAWTALTFFDQAINVSVLRFRYILAGLSSLVLGLSIWATIAFGLTSISIPAPLGWTASTLMSALVVAVPGSALFIFYTLFYVATPYLAKLVEKKVVGGAGGGEGVPRLQTHMREFSTAGSMLSRADTMLSNNEYEFIDVSDRNDLKHVSRSRHISQHSLSLTYSVWRVMCYA